MRILKYLLWLMTFLAGIFIVFLIYATIDDYKPPAEEVKYTSEHQVNLSDSIFTILVWNIGYAGLDSSMDFFYDGGKKVRPEREEVQRNLEQIMQNLKKIEGFDFFLLQEVDKKSKRSYRINMYNQIATSFPDYHTSFGKNYDVAFVPLPLSNPMGKVVSGLQTLSLHQPEEVVRHSFPGNYAWPTNLFMLDRCFLVNRYPLQNGNELVIINTHNSAYDDGSLRKQQMEYLEGFLESEYASGNHVIAGGDWNQCPPGFKPAFPDDIFDEENLSFIKGGYPEDAWTWAYDPSTPTNRRVMTPYTRGKTPTTVIDFFLLSPNTELISVAGINLDFAWSDHHPVIMSFKLKQQ